MDKTLETTTNHKILSRRLADLIVREVSRHNLRFGGEMNRALRQNLFLSNSARRPSLERDGMNCQRCYNHQNGLNPLGGR
ncbi:hypothetical protein [Coleofasciculus chthonoplastes]|uniref:hypothetical protein n=1 Tax=Coleofasciculus chthonoplastes TaxID=64178 RepID=UPI0032F26F86